MVETEGVDAESDDVAFLDEECSGVGVDTWVVERAGRVEVKEGGWVRDTAIPSRIHGDEGVVEQSPVLSLPGAKVIEGQTGIWVRYGAVGDPDDGEWCDEFVDGDLVDRCAISGEMSGRVDVSAGVFVDRQHRFVPVVGLDPRDDRELKWWHSGEERKVRCEPMRQVDDVGEGSWWCGIRRLG